MSLFRSLFVFPNRVATLRPRAQGRPADIEELSIDTDEGRVEAWFLPASLSHPRPAPLVVFAHGNGELIEDWPRVLAPYREMGMHLLLVEYRGYGRSAGRPSESSVTEDTLRFVELCLARPDVDPLRVAYHGRSIGGGVVCAVALRRKPSALILMSTFTSVPDVAGRFLVPRAWVPDRFENVAALESLNLPALIVHGERDRLIPVSHAQKLAMSHPDNELHVDSLADHNNCPTDWDAFWKRTRGYLARRWPTAT